MAEKSKIYQIAAIDIGTNAVRLGIFTVIEHNGEKKYLKDSFTRVPLRLGYDTFVLGKLTKKTEQDLVNTILAFKLLMNVNKVTVYKAYATSALRNSSNKKEVIAHIEKKTGIEVKVIGGAKEAKLVATLDYSKVLTDKQVGLLVDLGGGSTEISILYEQRVIATRSFELGTIRILNDKVSQKKWDALEAWVTQYINGRRNVVTIGFGGNVKSMFKIARVIYDEQNSLSFNQIKKVHEKLKNLSFIERIFYLDLKPNRADVLIPACQVFLTVMKAAGSTKVKVPRASIIEGTVEALLK